jgi:hypothetical protein
MELMSTQSYVVIGERALLFSRESYIPDVVALFTESELENARDSYGYVSRVDALRDRLQLHGFTSQRARADFERAVLVWHSQNPNPGEDAMGALPRSAESLLDELESYLNSSAWVYYEEPIDVLRQLDPRSELRLALDLVHDATTPASYNLDHLATRGFLTRGRRIAQEARDERRQSLALDAPLVVLTEGTSDSELLTLALSVTHPHLSDFLRFMDFASGAEGGVASLVKVVRAFIGAGIANRVVAIADNDTAAHDGLQKLKRERLPDGYRIRHFPDLPLLAHYATQGPQSDQPVVMDVNGLAGSLEMYLGRDVLTDGVELVPVQWTGYNDGLRRYQGALAKGDKGRIQDAFRSKVTAALLDPAAQANQDWSGTTAIIQTILDASTKRKAADGGANR